MERIDLAKLEATLNETPEAASKPQTNDATGNRVSPLRPQRRDITPNGNLPSVRTGPTDVVQAMAQTRTTESILAERQTTHGDFTDNSRVMQSLKRIIWAERGWSNLSDPQREGLEMILHKIGRIISGNPNVKDHWDDIAGYAKLCSDRIMEN